MLLASRITAALALSAIVAGAVIYDSRSKEETTLEIDDLVVNFGFLANLGPIRTWGLEIEKISI